MDQPIMTAENLQWQIKNNMIVDIRALQIFPGDHLALIGPNGSGKSSLLKLLAFLEKPTKGIVNLNIPGIGRSAVEKRRQMAVVFQEPLLLNMTVYDNIAYGIKLRRQQRELKGQVEHWLERLKIKHLAKRYPKNLSGGEAQRVSIARALAMEPKILFLDEPFSALDAPTKSQLLEEIGGIIKQSDITSVFITHDFSDIPFMADKVLVMSQGKLVQQGIWEEIFYRPVDADVAKLVGADIDLSGEITKTGPKEIMVRLSSGHTLLVANNQEQYQFVLGQRVRLFIRSEDVVLGQGTENNFHGVVEKLSPHGFQYKLTINCGFLVGAIINKHQVMTLKPQIDSKYFVHIDSKRVHLILE